MLFSLMAYLVRDWRHLVGFVCTSGLPVRAALLLVSDYRVGVHLPFGKTPFYKGKKTETNTMCFSTLTDGKHERSSAFAIACALMAYSHCSGRGPG